MASLSLSCLPTMPLLIHQPITTTPRHGGPQNAFFVCVKVPTLKTERGGQRHNKSRDCWRMCQRWNKVYLEPVIARRPSDLQKLGVFSSHDLFQLCCSRGFVVRPQNKSWDLLINALLIWQNWTLGRTSFCLCVYEQIKQSGSWRGSYLIS